MASQVVKVTLPRFEQGFAWTNRILRVDLSSGRIWAQDAAPYLPDFLGGRGLAAKILWEEYPQPVDAFDPRNPLMVFPGALTGTRSPYSGRTTVCAFSPQCYPYNWFSRANIGSVWGATLKNAGYDGVVVTGASDRPVYILIQDDEVSIRPAHDLWGLDTIETQEVIVSAHGKAVVSLTIGPAGEQLSRIATIHTATTSVAGQGGFGAVMGSKKLKAIAVAGSGRVEVADPDRLKWLYLEVGEEARSQRGRRKDLTKLNDTLQAEGGGKVRAYACTDSCPAPCRLNYLQVQGCHFDRKWSGAIACVSNFFRGDGGQKNRIVYDWDLGLRGGVELNLYANRLGLNHWDILVGIIPWLRMCRRERLLGEINGRAVDLNAIEFWAHLLRAMAYRDGDGDALAEGGWRAAQAMNVGVEIMRRHYTGWGYAGHWDGHAAFINPIVYPFWIVGALHWAMDTRDPASSTHGYVQNVMCWGPFGRNSIYPTTDPLGPEAAISWDQMRAIGERVYGRADTLDPTSGYDGKAIPAAYHGVRSVVKDCLPVDDQVFPLIYSNRTEDRYCRIGDIEGPDVEAALLRAATGLDWDTKELERAGERILNLERAITIRHWGRTRAMDERVLPYFEYQENWTNPEIGVRMALNRSQFLPVMDEYYRLRGWDVASGWPRKATLERLGLTNVHEAMTAGAAQARERLPELPPERPVVDCYADPAATSEAQ